MLAGVLFFAIIFISQSVAEQGYCLCYCHDNKGANKYFNTNQTTADCAVCFNPTYCAKIEGSGGLDCPSGLNQTREAHCTPINGVNWEGNFQVTQEVRCNKDSCCCPSGKVTIQHNKTGDMSFISFFCNGLAPGQQEVYFQASHGTKYYAIKYPGGQLELVYNDVDEIYFYDNFGECKSIVGIPAAPPSKAGMVVGIIFGIILFIGLAIGGYMYYRNRIGSGYTQL